GHRGVVELERDSHLGEHLVVALEREQRLTQDNTALDSGRPTEQSQAADLDGLLVLPGADQRLASRDEVALRHRAKLTSTGLPTGDSPAVWVLILHHRFRQPWHLGAAQAGFVDHQPALTVALPGLERVGLVDGAVGALVPAELDLDVGFAVPA